MEREKHERWNDANLLQISDCDIVHIPGSHGISFGSPQFFVQSLIAICACYASFFQLGKFGFKAPADYTRRYEYQ